MSIDWSDISKLRFRDFDAEIIEVLVPKNKESLSLNYPVFVFTESRRFGTNVASYTIDGQYNSGGHCEHVRDIIQIREEPFSFLEIVGLIIKGANFRDVKAHSRKKIVHIDLQYEEFNSQHEDGKRYINNLKYFRENVIYSLDGTNYSKLYKEIK